MIEAAAKAESRGATGLELRIHHVMPAAAKTTIILFHIGRFFVAFFLTSCSTLISV